MNRREILLRFECPPADRYRVDARSLRQSFQIAIEAENTPFALGGSSSHQRVHEVRVAVPV
jgi:hypothetical protein